MNLSFLGRLAGLFVVTAALAGCVDIDMDVKVKSDATAQATMSQTISAQFYPMIKGMQDSTKTAGKQDDSSDGFCDKDGKLTENKDGSATCVIVKDGKFADLSFDDDKNPLKFTSPGPGLVRVAFPTAEMQSGLSAAAAGADAASAGATGNDPDAAKQAAQIKAMMTAYFAGHFMTLKVDGGTITDSNMTISGDKQSATQKIALDALMSGTAKLPAELYAVVKVK